jgi:hypothetical protein
MPQILLLFHAALSRARWWISASKCAVPESINWPPFDLPNQESPRHEALPLRAGRLSALLFTPFEYMGHAELADEAGLFHGEVIDLREVAAFHGTSVEELEGRSATR